MKRIAIIYAAVTAPELFDVCAFRRALGCFPTGVGVVTTLVGGLARGITVNSFTSVSLDPPLILWCIDARSSRSPAFTAAKAFTISVLAREHEMVSARLATPGEHGLDGLELVETALGPPAIADALAVLECTQETLHEAGDHTIIVGRVARFTWRKNGEPLVFFRGRYGALARTGEFVA